MKRSGLTKALSILLAIISLSALVSGLFGMRSAVKDRQKGEEELTSLQNNIDDYRNLTALMMDSDDYDQLRTALEKQKRDYDRTTTQHRKDLAIFTATNGGLETGAQSLAQAEAAMASGRTQLEAGKQQLQLQAAAFQTIYETAMAGKKQLEDSLPILDAAETMVTSLRHLLESLRRIGDIMELPEESAEAEDKETPKEELSDSSTTEENEPPNREEDRELQNKNDSEKDIPEITTTDDENPENQPGVIEEESSQKTGSQEEQTAENPDSESSDMGEEEIQGSSFPEEDNENKSEEADSKSDETEEVGTEQELRSASEKTEPKSGAEEAEQTSPRTGTDDNQEAMRQSALEAYDAALSTYRDAVTVIDTLQDREIPTSMMKEMLKREGITKPEELKKLAEQAGLELTQEQEQILEELFTSESVVLFTSAQVAELKAELENAAGMPLDELLEKIQNERDAIAAEEGNFEVNAEQFGTIRRAYTDNKESILRMADVLEKELPVLEEALVSGKAQIEAVEQTLEQVEAAKKAMDQGLNEMNAAEGALYQGELMLAQGEAQLADTREKQLEKAEQLENEKLTLNQTEKALRQLSEEAEERKKLEEQEKSLRQALLSWEQIRQRNDAGEELLSAAESWQGELSEQTVRNYRMRFDASILLILSGILALTTSLLILGAENTTYTAAFASLLCAICSVGAVVLLIRLGRGISYSGLLVGGLASAELILLVWDIVRKINRAAE